MISVFVLLEVVTMTKVAVGVLAVSYLGKHEEAGPYTERYAARVLDICIKLYLKGYDPIIVAEGEAARAIKRHMRRREPGWFLKPASRKWSFKIIYGFDDDRHPNVKKIFEEALPFFEEHKVQRIIAVVEPRIHRPYVYWLARHHFKPMSERVWRYAVPVPIPVH